MTTAHKIIEKNWVVKDAGNKETATRLSSELGVSKLMGILLVNRNTSTFEQAREFFRPELEMLHDPFLIRDMDKAILRIEKAIDEGEKILVYGDYDVDGTTAVSLTYSFFIKYHSRIAYYIPDREKEGYGVSMQGVDHAIENNFTLVICLDCGIKANKTIAYAKENGIDFIVCDHHLPGEELPPAIAILDPKRAGCNYPYKELSGCGIGFKVIQAYAQKKQLDFKEVEPFLDLVAVSIASDIVPIQGENRVLAYYGLKQINSSPRLGIKAIIEFAKIQHDLTIENLVFIIGPRINAAGRISTGRDAVALLISSSKEEAARTCALVNQHNTERREHDKTTTEEALQLIYRDESYLNRKTTVLYQPHWHKGVVGIVASRLIESYYRPTIVLTGADENKMASGSARSVLDFSVYNAILECKNLLEQFGGHKYAAGLKLKVENIKAFQEKFEKVVSEQIDDALLIPRIEIDANINFSDITPKFIRILKQFEPFGPGNMMPVFRSDNIVDNGYASLVGGDKKHLRFNVRQQADPAISFNAIGFNLGNQLDIVNSKTPFSICYTIEENHWNGVTSTQLNIKDLRHED
jgi:single-stranded-DNA-specific exonuclease